MVYVMISTTIGIAHLMGVIAVDHALIKSYVLNVCVKLDTLIEFQMYWLKMVSGCKSMYVFKLYQASRNRLDNVSSQN